MPAPAGQDLRPAAIMKPPAAVGTAGGPSRERPAERAARGEPPAAVRPSRGRSAERSARGREVLRESGERGPARVGFARRCAAAGLPETTPGKGGGDEASDSSVPCDVPARLRGYRARRHRGNRRAGPRKRGPLRAGGRLEQAAHRAHLRVELFGTGPGRLPQRGRDAHGRWPAVRGGRADRLRRRRRLRLRHRRTGDPEPHLRAGPHHAVRRRLGPERRQRPGPDRRRAGSRRRPADRHADPSSAPGWRATAPAGSTSRSAAATGWRCATSR